MRESRRSERSDETGAPGQDRSAGSFSRWSAAVAGLDAFWPMLAVVLAVAVIFVASVAHLSMDSVGVAAIQSEALIPEPTTTRTTLMILQVSSRADRAGAQAAVKELAGRGIAAKILDSDDYRPLNPGYFVVYTGPYPATAAGRAEAKRLQARLPGALIREVEPVT